MHVIEILAIIFSVLAITKVLICLLDPMTGIRASEEIMKRPPIATAVYLVATVIVGWLVLTNMSPAQAGAGMLFGFLLMGLALIPNSREFLGIIQQSCSTREDALCKNWLSLIVWTIVAFWILVGVIVFQVKS
jgi:hypothetical protein